MNLQIILYCINEQIADPCYRFQKVLKIDIVAVLTLPLKIRQKSKSTLLVAFFLLNRVASECTRLLTVLVPSAQGLPSCSAAFDSQKQAFSAHAQPMPEPHAQPHPTPPPAPAHAPAPCPSPMPGPCPA
nr:acrosin-like [Penaeus vannamei]